MNAKMLINTGMKFLKQNSPIILAGVAVVGVGATIATSIYCDRKAREKLDEDRKVEKEKNEDFKDFGEKEKVKRTWKCYVPVAAVGGITIGSIIMSKHIDMKRQAALMALYTASETKFEDYREQVKKTFGEKKDQEIKDSVAEDKVKAASAGGPIVFQGATANGILCYDMFNGCTFVSDKNMIESARNEINSRLVYGEDYITLSEFYEYLGIDSKKLGKLGEDVGWDGSNFMEITFSSVLNEYDQPCLAIEYNYLPLWSGNFSKRRPSDLY